jgi:hypothetical protein
MPVNSAQHITPMHYSYTHAFSPSADRPVRTRAVVVMCAALFTAGLEWFVMFAPQGGPSSGVLVQTALAASAPAVTRAELPVAAFLPARLSATEPTPVAQDAPKAANAARAAMASATGKLNNTRLLYDQMVRQHRMARQQQVVRQQHKLSMNHTRPKRSGVPSISNY